MRSFDKHWNNMNFNQQTKTLTGFSTELTQGPTRNAMKAAGASSRDLWMVEADKICVIEGFNPRIHDDKYEQHIQTIKNSMLQTGYDLSKPLTGYVGSDGNIYLTDGHTRLAAYHVAVAEGLEPTPLPVVPKDRGVSMEDLTIGLVVSNNGKPLTSYEIAIVCKRLSTTYHRTAKEIAAVLHISDKYVGQLLDLAAAPVAIREMVQNGEISASLAIEMLAKHKEGATEAIKAAVGKAGAAGKAKVTKKATVSPEELKLKREKKLAHRLFAAVELLLADQKVIEVIDPEVYKEIDTCFFERDKTDGK